MKNFFIDVSEHQGTNINFSRLKEQVDGVIVRVQYGSNYEDRTYKHTISKLKENGIPFGVYAWVRGSSYSDMRTEARDFYTRATNAGADNSTWFFLDVEEQSMGDMRGGCENYRDELKKLGVQHVGVYVANHLFNGFNLDVDKFDCLWVPTYGNNDAYHDEHSPQALHNADIHQYSSTGRLDSIPGVDLDCNRCENGFSPETIFGGGEPVQKQPTENNTGSENNEYYNVKLSAIRAKGKLGIYKDEKLTERVRYYDRGTEFNLTGDIYTGSTGATRYKTQSGFWISGNKKYIDPVYYLETRGKIKLKKSVNIYKDVNMTQLVRSYGPGTVFNVVGNEMRNDLKRSFKTESGFYITSHKDYVALI